MNMLTIEKVIRNWAEETTIDFDDKRNICCYSFQYDEKFFPKLLRKITKTPHKEKDKKNGGYKLAEMFGVSRNCISNIVKNKTYRIY